MLFKYLLSAHARYRAVRVTGWALRLSMNNNRAE